jgi:hypothetical protein
VMRLYLAHRDPSHPERYTMKHLRGEAAPHQLTNGATRKCARVLHTRKTLAKAQGRSKGEGTGAQQGLGFMSSVVQPGP